MAQCLFFTDVVSFILTVQFFMGITRGSSSVEKVTVCKKISIFSIKIRYTVYSIPYSVTSSEFRDNFCAGGNHLSAVIIYSLKSRGFCIFIVCFCMQLEWYPIWCMMILFVIQNKIILSLRFQIIQKKIHKGLVRRLPFCSCAWMFGWNGLGRNQNPRTLARNLDFRIHRNQKAHQ